MATRFDLLSDTEVINKILKADEVDEAIRFLYRSHYEFLGRYITNNKGSWDDAQDIFQEVLVAFINIVKGGRFRGESSIKTFLYSLTKNTWLNELKKRGRAQVRELKYDRGEEKTEGAIDAAMELRETNKELMKVIEALGENCKKILLLFYFENRSMKEIVEQLPYENEQVVRNKKSKCLKQLEGLLKGNKNLYQQLKTVFNG